MQTDNSGYGSNIELNSAAGDEMSERDLDAYVSALVATARQARGKDHVEVTKILQDELDAAGVSENDVVTRNLAETIMRSDGDISITVDSGEVLYGPGAAKPARHEPNVHGDDDPEHPDRPALT